MERSEQLAAMFGGVGLLHSHDLMGWRTLTLPHDSPWWPLLIPLGLLILLAAMTPVARGAKARFWTIAQIVVYFAALGAGLVVVGTILTFFWKASQGLVEEPGLLLILFTVAFVPACAYLLCILSIDQAKFGGRIRAARWSVASAGLLPMLLLGACMILD